jgi:LPS sulfotransferase NodH
LNSYIICATPRTGSTLLCDLLTSTEVAGFPDSFFMKNADPVWVKAWELPARENLDEAAYSAAFLKAAIKAGKGETGIFGLRLMRENLDGLLALINNVYPGLPTDKARLEAAFGSILYIHLARRDKLAQAVSLIKAEQTGLWHIAPDGTEVERLAPHGEPQYDFGKIARTVEELERYDAAWLTWFGEQGIEPLRITYENLSASPVEVLMCICNALGVATPAPEKIEPGVAKLADAVSVGWMRQYQRDLGAQSH